MRQIRLLAIVAYLWGGKTVLDPIYKTGKVDDRVFIPRKLRRCGAGDARLGGLRGGRRRKRAVIRRWGAPPRCRAIEIRRRRCRTPHRHRPTRRKGIDRAIDHNGGGTWRRPAGRREQRRLPRLPPWCARRRRSGVTESLKSMAQTLETSCGASPPTRRTRARS